MLRKIAGVAILATVNPVVAQEPVFVLSLGRTSCAMWLESDASEKEGMAWLTGYWLGLNLETNGSQPGSSAALPMMDEVKLRCHAEPSLPMLVVADRVLREFRDVER
jgi:hypothetical protein